MKKTMQQHNNSVSTSLIPVENQTHNGAIDQNRRRFMKLNLLGLALASTASLVLSGNALAVKNNDGEPALLDPEDQQAKAAGYTVPSPTSQKSCSNCQLYTGKEGADSGPCALFSYRNDTQSGKPLWVRADGWCRAWAPRQA
jgi:hypothetical protein